MPKTSSIWCHLSTQHGIRTKAHQRLGLISSSQRLKNNFAWEQDAAGSNPVSPMPEDVSSQLTFIPLRKVRFFIACWLYRFDEAGLFEPSRARNPTVKDSSPAISAQFSAAEHRVDAPVTGARERTTLGTWGSWIRCSQPLCCITPDPRQQPAASTPQRDRTGHQTG